MKPEFSLSRFGLVLKRDALQHSRVYINLFLGLFIAYVLMEIILMFSYNSDYGHKPFYDYSESQLYGLSVLALAGLALFMLIAVSKFSFDQRQKPSSINALMLPASRLEKFFSRWLLLVPGAYLLGVAAFICADLVRLVVQPVLFDYQLPCAIPSFFENHSFLFPQFTLNSFFGYEVKLLSEIGRCLLLIFIHASYLLGGVLFKKRGAIITTLIYFAAFILFTTVTAHIIDMTDSASFVQNYKPGIVYYTVLNAVLAAGIGLCVWGAYRRFSRMQVI